MEVVDKEAKKLQEQLKELETKYEGLTGAKGKVEEKKIEAAADKSTGLLA